MFTQCEILFLKGKTDWQLHLLCQEHMPTCNMILDLYSSGENEVFLSHFLLAADNERTLEWKLCGLHSALSWGLQCLSVPLGAI